MTLDENDNHDGIHSNSELEIVGENEVISASNKVNETEELNSESDNGVCIIVEPSRRKKVKKAKVFIEGKLDVSNAQFISDKIKEVITNFNIIDFKLRKVESFDLSSVQIFHYYREIYRAEEKAISFQIEDLPITLKSILVKTKYNKILFKKPIK